MSVLDNPAYESLYRFTHFNPIQTQARRPYNLDRVDMRAACAPTHYVFGVKGVAASNVAWVGACAHLMRYKWCVIHRCPL